MTTAGEIHALATWGTPAVSATRLRPFGTGYPAPLRLRRVRH